MTNAEKMKNRRVMLGLNVQEFAEAMNVSDSTVYKWEKGLRNPCGSAWMLSYYLLKEANKV